MKKIILKVISLLCTVLELVAYIIVGTGIQIAFSGEVFRGIMMFLGAVAGIVCIQVIAGLTEAFDEIPSVRHIKKAVKETNLTEAIKKETDTAIEVFNLHPSFRLYFYVRKLNPEAAKIIRQHIASELKRKGK